MPQPKPNLVLAPGWTADSMVAFFEQFEPALPGFVPVRSDDDRSTMSRDLVEVGSKIWWDRIIKASTIDGHAAAIEFRDRMRKERLR